MYHIITFHPVRPVVAGGAGADRRRVQQVRHRLRCRGGQRRGPGVRGPHPSGSHLLRGQVFVALLHSKEAKNLFSKNNNENVKRKKEI